MLNHVIIYMTSLWKFFSFFSLRRESCVLIGYCFLEISRNKFSKAMLRLKLKFCKSCWKSLLTKVDEDKKNWHKSVKMLNSIKNSANFPNHFWGILKNLWRNGIGGSLALIGSKLHAFFLIFKDILFWRIVFFQMSRKYYLKFLKSTPIFTSSCLHNIFNMIYTHK